ncbi:MAG: choice-of-anchor K domain-containing protein [Betaproteobacteria bacterium]
MRFNSIVAACALAVAALQAVADPVSGSTSGTWVNPTSGAGIVTTGVGTPAFTWGDGSAGDTGPSSVDFAAVAGGFSTVTETPFKVGTLTYFNGTTALGSTPDSVQLALTLDFLSPTIPSVTSDYTFDIVTTSNTDDPDASADFLNLPSAFSTTSFVIGGTTYNVKLTGFSNIVGDGFLASDDLALHVREGGTASADLFAVVTTEVAVVPEPQSIALLLAGLGMVGGMARRRRG